MGLFQIIDDKFRWDELLKKFKEADIYYSFEYGNLFVEKEQGILLAAYYENEYSKVFYPFIKRKVDWKKEVIFDIVTPYGYGGPLIEGSCEALVQFYDYVEDFCKKNKIITETIRFHPINKNHEQCKKVVEVEYIRKTTAVDLSMPLEEIRKHYSSMNKRNIKRAKNLGLFCYSAKKTQKNIHTFIDLYKETMGRKNADGYYFFDDKHFFELIKDTGKIKSYLLFVQYGTEIIAAVMVLIGPIYSHYHLGASKLEFLHLKPNNLLFDFMIEFCKLKGSTLLHLGGGYQENDGLFQFKTSFTNNNNFEYYLGKRIYDENKYNRFIKEVMSNYKVNENYFPIYRGKKETLLQCEVERRRK